ELIAEGDFFDEHAEPLFARTQIVFGLLLFRKIADDGGETVQAIATTPDGIKNDAAPIARAVLANERELLFVAPVAPCQFEHPGRYAITALVDQQKPGKVLTPHFLVMVPLEPAGAGIPGEHMYLRVE